MRKEWRDVSAKPEKIVRRKFVRTLAVHYGCTQDQVDQEQRTQHGHRSPRGASEIAAKAFASPPKLIKKVEAKLKNRFYAPIPSLVDQGEIVSSGKGRDRRFLRAGK